MHIQTAKSAMLLTTVLLSGCAASTITSSPGPIVAPAHSVYVAVPPTTLNPPISTHILQFDAAANGSTTPITDLALPLNFSLFGLASDQAGQLYITGSQKSGAQQILIYAAASTGAASPARTIIPSIATGDTLAHIAVDSSGLIYVTDSLSSTILIYAADTNGTTTPLRRIQWDGTQFSGSGELAVDATGYVYLAGYAHATIGGLINPGQIYVFAPGASGLVAPTRTLVGANTLFYADIPRISVDQAGGLYVVADMPGSHYTQIGVFAPGASGNIAPGSVLVPNFTSPLLIANEIQANLNGNLYVLARDVNSSSIAGQPSPSPDAPTIGVFLKTASGTVSPTTQFTSSSVVNVQSSFATH